MIRALVFLATIVYSFFASAQNAADAYYDREAMNIARAAIKTGHGAQIHSMLLMERLEMHSGQSDEALLWDAQAWVGGDAHKLWLKTEGHYDLEQSDSEEVEFQALYSKAVSPFWDVQAGVRHDSKPTPTRTYAVVGLQGLAPYWFEVDTSVFVSENGDASVRIEAEYDLRLTQRLLLQPRIEINAAFSDDQAVDVGTGFSGAEAGLRLRYEIVREFAPYIGVSAGRVFGKTANLVRQSGKDTDEFNWVVGLRFWF